MPNLACRLTGRLTLAAALLAQTACAPQPPRVDVDPSWPDEKPPVDYVAPARFDTLHRMLPQLHAVVVGTVSDIAFDYDDCWGPRTVVTVEGVRSLVGASAVTTLKLKIFGGPLPDGRWLEFSELPRYALGARYVLFLRNTDWRLSPVMGDLAYRVETVAGKEVLLTTEGRAVTGLDEEGIKTQTRPLTGAVGLQVKGLDRPTTTGPTEAASAQGANGHCEAARGIVCGPALVTSEETARRRDQLLVSHRFAVPPVLPGVTTADVAYAWGLEDLRRELLNRASALPVEIGGRFIDRPRLGCWRKTPLIHWERRHVDIVNPVR